MASKSPIMAMFLEPFKAAAAEGAALELKLRLLAGTIPALQKYAHQRKFSVPKRGLKTRLSLILCPRVKAAYMVGFSKQAWRESSNTKYRNQELHRRTSSTSESSPAA